jgi:protein SCO1/2
VKRFTRTLAAALLAVLAVVSCGQDAATEDLVGLERSPAMDVGSATLPDVTESDEGTPGGFSAEPGRLAVTYFGYTHCPDLCPTTLADLRSAMRRIGEDAETVDLVFVTVDPERDTPELLRQYVGSFTDRYRVLRTTDPEELRRAERPFLASSSVTVAPDGTIEVAHSASAYVVDASGRVLVEWPFGVGAKGMENDLRIIIERLEDTTP